MTNDLEHSRFQIYALQDGAVRAQALTFALRTGMFDRLEAGALTLDDLRFELGLSVPGDVSVVGYDDVPLASWPAYDLTTIRQPVRRMVDATVDALIAQIEGDGSPRKVQIDGPLIIRGSARVP